MLHLPTQGYIEYPPGGVSYAGSEIINVHKTKEQREHNKTLFPNPNQNNNGSFVVWKASDSAAARMLN